MRNTSFKFFFVLSLVLALRLLAGCSEAENDVTSDMSDFEEELATLMEEFESRTIYSSLDPDVLSEIPDDKLEQAIVDYVSIKIGDDWENMEETIDALPTSFRGFFVTWMLEAEVNNGGFNQFFWNSYGYWAEDAISALEDYGAKDHAEITKKAVAMFLSEADSHRKFREVGTLEAFSESYKHTDLGDLDNEFYALEESLSELRIAYVRRNPDKFIGN